MSHAQIFLPSTSICATRRRHSGPVAKHYITPNTFYSQHYSNYLGSRVLHLCSPTCITSAPWTRKMPGRSLCPKAAEARGRRQGAGRRRACPAWHVGIAWPFRRALLSHAHPSPLGSQRIIAQIFGACGIQTDIYRSQHSTSRVTEYKCVSTAVL